MEDLLPRFRALDRTSPQFPDQLDALFDDKDFRGYTRSLQPDDAMWVIEYLDAAVCDLDSNAPVYRRCLRALRWMCSTFGMLPKSYMVSAPFHRADDRQPALGGFSDVWKCSDSDGQIFAVKALRVSNECHREVKKVFCNEVLSLGRLAHPNVLPLLGVAIEPLQLVSDWMPSGNIVEYIKTHPVADRLSLLSDIAEGLSYLHSRDLIHGNLKGSNVLIDGNQRGCLTDFGLSAVTLALEPTALGGGTLRWTAPEILAGEGVASKEADMYALGMVIYEVFAGRVPFADSPPTTVAVEVLSGKRPERPKHPDLVDELWDLTEQCWEQEPLQRPETSGVVYRLRRLLACQRDHASVAGTTAVDDTALGRGTLRNALWSLRGATRRLWFGASSYSAPRSSPRQFWQYHGLGSLPNSMPTSDTINRPEPGESETNPWLGKSLDNVNPSGSRNLLPRAAFWKSSHGTPPARKSNDGCSILSEKVLS